ncbi:hypothetical protein C0J52_17710, partial [Blattella germanica]
WIADSLTPSNSEKIVCLSEFDPGLTFEALNLTIFKQEEAPLKVENTPADKINVSSSVTSKANTRGQVQDRVEERHQRAVKYINITPENRTTVPTLAPQALSFAVQKQFWSRTGFDKTAKERKDYVSRAMFFVHTSITARNTPYQSIKTMKTLLLQTTSYPLYHKYRT